MLTSSSSAAADARAALGSFAVGHTSYLVGASPAEALRLPTREVFDALYARLGPVLAQATHPARQIASPKAAEADGAWLQRSQSVGINLRTTGGLLGALKFVLTLPPHIDAIHLLPVFEPGVVGSLYGMASWRVNAEFFDREWAAFMPQQRHVNDQLRAFVNLCHALGKTVGLDVIPHTDRFSEIALSNPWLFEWVRRKDATLLDHRAGLHEEVMGAIVGHRLGRSSEQLTREFFGRPEAEIARDLFGDGDVASRNARRDVLIQWLYDFGYETLPATMAPPYRGLELDPREEAVTVDFRGRRWREFRFVDPGPMSRVFGPLARYHLWETRDDNARWELDHDRPRKLVWEYVAAHYAAFASHYGFDFMRGDMSHVQTRPEGVPAEPVAEPYDLLRFVKAACAKTQPHFAYFAESFLTADDYMTYGSEADHLDRSRADVALGNLQNFAPHDAEFHRVLAEYEALRGDDQGQTGAGGHHFAPAFTVFTADKDDPRFDASFLRGNVARYFFATFCPRFPVYTALGFRTRDPHLEPAPNESYTKLYVFHYDEGPQATTGPYRFGNNQSLWAEIQRIDAFRQKLAFDHQEAQRFDWLLAPDATGKRQVVAWVWGGYRFAVNFGLTPAAVSFETPKSSPEGQRDSPLDSIFVTPRGAWDAGTLTLAPDSGVAFFG